MFSNIKIQNRRGATDWLYFAPCGRPAQGERGATNTPLIRLLLYGEIFKFPTIRRGAARRGAGAGAGAGAARRGAARRGAGAARRGAARRGAGAARRGRGRRGGDKQKSFGTCAPKYNDMFSNIKIQNRRDATDWLYFASAAIFLLFDRVCSDILTF